MEKKFKIKFIDCTESSLKEVGFDSSYVHKAMDKHSFSTIKIFQLNCAQANILKQTALSVGADCAVHREVITGNVELSDCILSGSISQLYKICEKLKFQPFNLQALSMQIKDMLVFKPSALLVRNSVFDFSQRVYLMGILNVTPDSFSDGGMHDRLDLAISHYKFLVDSGADIVDVGGESTRPYSSAVSVDEEISRVIPVIEKIRTFDKNTVISIDTRNSLTAKLALEAGADIVNDISALDYDGNMLSVLLDKNCPVILNHSTGTPDIMQNNIFDSDVVEEIYNYFDEKINYLTKNGLDISRIILDPGIGFGKTLCQNFEIIKRLGEFKTLQCPMLVGHSRKKFLQEGIWVTDNDSLDSATTVVSSKLIDNGVNILRVHNVKMHNDLLKINKLLS